MPEFQEIIELILDAFPNMFYFYRPKITYRAYDRGFFTDNNGKKVFTIADAYPSAWTTVMSKDVKYQNDLRVLFIKNNFGFEQNDEYFTIDRISYN